MVRLFLVRFLLGAAGTANGLVRSGTCTCSMIFFRFKEGENCLLIVIGGKEDKSGSQSKS